MHLVPWKFLNVDLFNTLRLFRFDQVAMEIASVISDLPVVCKRMVSLYMSNLPKPNFKNMLAVGVDVVFGPAPKGGKGPIKSAQPVLSVRKILVLPTIRFLSFLASN